MKIMMGNEEVSVEVEATGRAWFYTERGMGLGRQGRAVSVADAMALVQYLTKQIPAFGNATYAGVYSDILAYEARERGKELNRKITELGMQYFGRDAEHLMLKERELIERLLTAEGGLA